MGPIVFGIFREISVTNLRKFQKLAGDSAEARSRSGSSRRSRRITSVVGTDCTASVSLTHVAIYACIIINGTRVGVVRTHVSERSAAYICATRGQRCVIALPIEFSYTGMASLMHKMTGPNSVIVRFTKRIRPRVVNIARRCERRCHIVTTEFSGARK